MYIVKGKVLKVEDGREVRGAFGAEPALQVHVQREPGSEYVDKVSVPDTPANRQFFGRLPEVEMRVFLTAKQYEGNAYISATAPFDATTVGK